MNKLPIYAKTLLLQGASMTGTFTEGYYFVEEKLRIKDANQLFEFCQWIDKNIGGAASGNIDMLFSAFKNPFNAELQKQANELANTIRRIKSL
jgi:hypothetical protein